MFERSNSDATINDERKEKQKKKGTKKSEENPVKLLLYGLPIT